MLIKIINLDKTIKKFGKLEGIDLMPEIKEATRKVQRTAKDLVPVDTGTLKRSIKTKMYSKQQSGVVYSILEYAPYVEFGTSKQKAQPFMIPAMNINRAGINQSMKKYLKEQIGKKI
jgi:HK97 gp10 family phage protein